ncbi:MAG: enoyl-CoA hydratase/isomerase family protein, partial [Candidatus Eremiobacteraeota bacterium]|nr:enoyl-CoA hydratase/isomerase family protein [Candidatus Eremiobacteraeota bacterium]
MAGELTRFERRDEIAVIALDSPPVNALGAELVASLAERIAAAVGDPHIHAVVIHGDNGIFSGGADIRGFAKEHSGPTLRDAIAAIEDAQKPFIAALEGNALGGGLELALACDYRIALARAKLGQPEIALGLIPGAGGTQRLPRLVGLAAAVEMIVGGDPVSAERAKELGLVDAVVGRDLVEAAVTFAHSVRRRRKTSAMPVRGDAAILDAKRLTADRNDRGGLAVHLAIDAIEAGVRTPFDLALAFERELFERLRASEQSKARVHVFFAERAAAKVAGVPEVRTHLRKAAVIGGGTMGTGIAMTLANAGIEVMLIDVDGDALVRSRERIERNYDSSLRKHKLTHAQVEERHARIGYSAQLAAAASAEIVIEAVFEEMELKQEIFRALDRTINVDAILATNTSTLDVDAIAGVTRRPGEVVGTHFFSPANVMRLLEIVRGKYTEPETLGRTLAFARQIGKVPVVAGNCDGFIGNRMLAHYRREADFLLEEGATPQQVDRVIRDFGFPMGPFAMVDLAG